MAKTRRENGEGTIRKLPSGKFQCTIETKDEFGERKIISASHEKMGVAKKLAKEKLAQYKASLINGVDGDEKLSTMTLEKAMIENWFDDYALGKWTSRTKKSRKQDLKIIFKKIGAVRIDKINAQMLNDCFFSCLTDKNRQQLGMVYAITRDFFEDMRIRGVLPDNPFNYAKKLPSPKKVIKEEYTIEEIDEVDFEDEDVKFFLDDEIKIMRDALDMIDMRGKWVYPRMPVYYLMFLTGMRGQELRALTIKDIDFEKHTIKINKAVSIADDENGKEHMVVKPPKTASSIRTIGINAETEKILHRIINERRNQDCPLLYPTSTGNWVSKDNFGRDFRKLLNSLDIPINGRGPHCLRHTFASYALEGNELSPLKNQKPIFISNYLGHKDLTTTYRIYAHLDKKKLAEISFEETERVIEIEYK